MTDSWFEDPVRLLRCEPFVDDVARQAMTIAAELLWDDLLDSVEADTIADALLIRLLPRQFRDRAAGDWRRWLATFTTVVEARPARSPTAGDDGRAAVRRRAHPLRADGRR